MSKASFYQTDEAPNTLLLAIQAPHNRAVSMESYFEEFLNLVKTNGIPYDHVVQMKLREIDSKNFLTKGRLAELKEFCDTNHIEHVIISEPLSPLQQRNMADAIECAIFDRTDLILDIFEKAATSAEGKTQVAIAKLEHQKTRLSGKGLGMAQQSGTIGVRGGFGETLKEKETRHIEGGILQLKRQLERLAKARETQRKSRLDAHTTQLCLIGYTNAGKSTILNTLTKSHVEAVDKLFATLDTTTRELYINSVKIGVLSDTVGFIQNLPHRLIAAFKSTLSELQYATLLLQVVDVSDPNWQSHIDVVHAILRELDVDKPMLYVFNKIDKVEEPDDLVGPLSAYQPHVVISAESKEGITPLAKFLYSWHQQRTKKPTVKKKKVSAKS